jgi:hypothetical protein
MQLLMRQLFASIITSVILSGSIGCQHICHKKSNLPPIDCSKTTSKAQPVPPPMYPTRLKAKNLVVPFVKNPLTKVNLAQPVQHPYRP